MEHHQSSLVSCRGPPLTRHGQAGAKYILLEQQCLLASSYSMLCMMMQTCCAADDGNEDSCGACRGIGVLICCEKCPAAFHATCAGYSMLLTLSLKGSMVAAIPTPCRPNAMHLSIATLDVTSQA